MTRPVASARHPAAASGPGVHPRNAPANAARAKRQPGGSVAGRSEAAP